MKRTIYFRVSTEAQSYDRQLFQITEYFNRMGISMESVEIISEKITSHTKFTERKIYPILKNATEGDVIYVCQLDRLGRSTIDVLQLVEYAVSKGVTIITCDNGQTIENRSQAGKLYLTILAAMAEMERELRAERCQAGIDAAREEIKKYGRRISRISGRVQTRWGNAKGTEETKLIMAAAREANALLRAEKSATWKQTSKAYKRALRKKAEGWTLTQTVADLTELYAENPEDYCTPNGCCPSKGTVSKWWRESNPLLVE